MFCHVAPIRMPLLKIAGPAAPSTSSADERAHRSAAAVGIFEAIHFSYGCHTEYFCCGFARHLYRPAKTAALVQGATRAVSISSMLLVT